MLESVTIPLKRLNMSGTNKRSIDEQSPTNKSTSAFKAVRISADEKENHSAQSAVSRDAKTAAKEEGRATRHVIEEEEEHSNSNDNEENINFK